MFRRLLLLTVLVIGCRPAPDGPSGEGAVPVVDDAGRHVLLEARPARIVSLVPTATEIIFALGEGHRVVGRSRFDDYPPEVLAVPDVGDAIRPSTEAVLLRDPDLVILVGGSDNAQAARDMEQLGVPILVVLFNTLDDLETNVRRLGRMLGREAEATGLWRSIEADLNAVARSVGGRERPTVYYDLGYPPAFTVGGGSYLDTLISLAGGRNVFGDLEAPSPRVSLEAVVDRDPDVLIEPAAGIEGPGSLPPASRPGWDNLRAVRTGAVVQVPADLMHRLGPRVGRAARTLAAALHPDLEKAP